MKGIIDTNILIDITQNNPDWIEWSFSALHHCNERLINPVIFSEFCGGYESLKEVMEECITLELVFCETPPEALMAASQAFRNYKQQGGTKNSTLPDFFIGAHAAAIGVPIITRDTAKYKTYFPHVELISPEN